MNFRVLPEYQIEFAKRMNLPSKEYLHIGINDIATEGTWQYATGGDIVYTNWGGINPNRDRTRVAPSLAGLISRNAEQLKTFLLTSVVGMSSKGWHHSCSVPITVLVEMEKIAKTFTEN